MAHELQDNVDKMFSVREKPWHYGTGTDVNLLEEHPASPREAQTACGLVWGVELVPLLLPGTIPAGVGTVDDNGGIHYEHDFYGIVRDDLNFTLGAVTEKYKPLQNDVMFDFLWEVMGVAGQNDQQIKLETAGSLRGGRIVWALARYPHLDWSVSDDERDYTGSYIAVMQEHTGKRSLVIQQTTVRIVCRNTQMMAIGEQRFLPTYKVRHMGDPMSRIIDAAEALHLFADWNEEMKGMMTDLAHTPANDAFFAETLKHVYPMPEGEAVKTKAATFWAETQGTLKALWSMYPQQSPRTAGTRYGVFQVFTEYWDHYDRVIGSSNISVGERRFERMLGDRSLVDQKTNLANYLLEV